MLGIAHSTAIQKFFASRINLSIWEGLEDLLYIARVGHIWKKLGNGCFLRPNGVLNTNMAFIFCQKSVLVGVPGHFIQNGRQIYIFFVLLFYNIEIICSNMSFYMLFGLTKPLGMLRRTLNKQFFKYYPLHAPPFQNTQYTHILVG